MRRLTYLLLALTVSCFGVGCSVELEHGLDERQANQIAALLDSSGVSAEKVRDDGSDGWKIVVAKTEMARAFRLLEANDLPRRDRRGMSELLAERSLLPSQSEEQARMELARSVELERTLEHVPGVVSARVHLASTTSGPWDPKASPGRASVLLRTSGTPSIDAAGVRALVAGSIAGVVADDVAVVFTTTAGDAASSPTAPLRAARTERGPLTAVLASGLALLIALGGALLWTALRLSASRGREGLVELQSPPSKRNG